MGQLAKKFNPAVFKNHLKLLSEMVKETEGFGVYDINLCFKPNGEIYTVHSDKHNDISEDFDEYYDNLVEPEDLSMWGPEGSDNMEIIEYNTK